MSLKAIIFDMDGVLTNTVEYHYRSWKKVVGEYGVPFTRKDNEKLLGLTRQRSLEVLLGERNLPEEQKQEILLRKNAYFLDSVAQMGPADLLPGIDQLLREIVASNLRIGVASASRNTQPVLKQLGIYSYIHTIIDGNDVQNSKPAPDIFLQTSAALQVQPDECLVIEDSAAGIQAAQAAGMCVAGVGPVQRVGQAHATLSSLSGVYLEDLLSVYNRWRASRLARPVVNNF